MSSPKPWNNNPSNLTINYGIKFREFDGGVAWDDFNVPDCIGGYQTAQQFSWDECAKPAHTEHNRPAYIASRKPPAAAKRVVDCTPHNDCSQSGAESVDSYSDSAQEGFVWLAVHHGRDCSSVPAVAYKMRAGVCTQFPVSGRTYWTGGCEGYACMWFSQGCTIGCPACTGETDSFRNLCGSSKQPTVTEPKFRTFNRYRKDKQGDWTASHPWRAPGNAPVLDACGMAGGFRRNNEGPGGHPPPGHRWGDRGSELSSPERTVWTAGSTAEVSWGIAANHGGGYQYRLCPKSEPLTEACFQRTPLPFADETQVLRLANGTSVKISGTFVSSGTLPEGSTWAMNPVPACAEAIPGTYGHPCDSPQFPPPPGCDETCWGDSDETVRSGHRHAVLPTIVDRLRIPATIPQGDYVLGWRWDCEQTPQVWSSCSDVTIVSGADLMV